MKKKPEFENFPLAAHNCVVVDKDSLDELLPSMEGIYRKAALSNTQARRQTSNIRKLFEGESAKGQANILERLTHIVSQVVKTK